MLVCRLFRLRWGCSSDLKKRKYGYTAEAVKLEDAELRR